MLIASAAVLVACGARTELGGEETDAAPQDAADECRPLMTVYGGPFIDAGCPPRHNNDAAVQDVTVAPPYGIAPDE